MEVVVGTIDLTPPKATNGIFRVKRIIVHPEYVTFQGNDVALVELSEEVSYSGFIQPLCPRQPGDVFTRGSPCYTAGWGKTDPASELLDYTHPALLIHLPLAFLPNA